MNRFPERWIFILRAVYPRRTFPHSHLVGRIWEQQLFQVPIVGFTSKGLYSHKLLMRLASTDFLGWFFPCSFVVLSLCLLFCASDTFPDVFDGSGVEMRFLLVSQTRAFSCTFRYFIQSTLAQSEAQSSSFTSITESNMAGSTF